jgi:hypothetical protein
MTPSDRSRAVLRFAATSSELPSRPGEDDQSRSERWLVLDPAWTPKAGDDAAGRTGLRQVAATVLARDDHFPTTTNLLDDWAETSGVIEALVIDGTSYWYRRKLWAWRWLHERLIWAGILDELARAHPLEVIELPGPDEPALRDIARLVAERDGLEVVEASPAPRAPDPGPVAETLGRADRRTDRPAPPPDGRARPGSPGLFDRLSVLFRKSGIRPSDRRRNRTIARRAAMRNRLDTFVAEGGGRLLAIVDPAVRQEVATASGTRSIDPFLGPVIDCLAGTALDPIVLDVGSRASHDDVWLRTEAPEGQRILAGHEVDGRFSAPDDDAESSRAAETTLARLRECRAPLRVAGIDLGPALRDAIERYVRANLPARLRETVRARRLLAALRPAVVLMVDEYGRTEWVAAAHQLGIPVAAVQHGIIHPWHPGYQHRSRPAVRPVPERTYCFGDYERQLLLDLGGYRSEEVVVSGSPRLDLMGEGAAPADVARIRAKVGVAPDEKLLVVSTTFAAVYRRFYTPVAFAALLGQPMPGIRVVVKLHPGEADGDLYRQLLAELGASDGIPRDEPIIVKRIDLYHLLAAADGHLGLYSTVLTEAVVTGTPNFLAAVQASSDLIGYVQAGVAVPVRTAEELRAAIDSGRDHVDPEKSRAFIDAHFRSGPAAQRIAADLLDWTAS